MEKLIIFSLLFGVGLVGLSGCSQKENKKLSMTKIKNVKHETDRANINMSVIASIEWGVNKNQIEPIIDDAPSFGTVSKEQMRKAYRTLLFKTDEKNGIHIMKKYGLTPLTNEVQIPIFHIDASENSIKKTIIPKLNIKDAKHRVIIDYTADCENNIYILEVICFDNGECTQRILKVNPYGEEVFQIQKNFKTDEYNSRESNDFNGELKILSGSRLVYLSKHKQYSIMKFNSETGELIDKSSLEYGYTNSICINDDEQIARSFFNESKNEDYFGFYNSDAVIENEVKDSLGIFKSLIGFDNENIIFAITDKGIIKFTTFGKIQKKLYIRDIVVNNYDNTIYTNWESQNTLFITKYDFEGKPNLSMEISIPQTNNSFYSTNRLIYVDEENNLYFHSGESPGNLGKLLVFSERGKMKKEIRPPFDLFSLKSNCHFMFSQLGSEGEIYLPVTDPYGMKFIKISF